MRRFIRCAFILGTIASVSQAAVSITPVSMARSLSASCTFHGSPSTTGASDATFSPWSQTARANSGPTYDQASQTSSLTGAHLVAQLTTDGGSPEAANHGSSSLLYTFTLNQPATLAFTFNVVPFADGGPSHAIISADGLGTLFTRSFTSNNPDSGLFQQVVAPGQYHVDLLVQGDFGYNIGTFDLDLQAIPEPSVLALFAAGFGCLARRRPTRA